MGSVALHTSADIAAFLGDGETRFIAAAYRDPERAGELYILGDNTARELRAWAKQELRCMFADCPSPDLTTVARARRRDGFAHFRGGGKHAPESINHRQGKAVIAAWLRRLYGPDTVAVEEATDTQRSNVADVLLTHPSGRRVAFEVQYAPLTVQAWRERHERYVRQGIIDIWLWGYTRVHNSRSSYAAGPFRLDDTQDELRQTGARVTFVNPETGQIGVAASAWNGRACLAFEREFDLAVCSLSGIQMSDDGLTSELIAHLAAVSRKRDAEIALQARREAERVEQLRRAAVEGARQYQEYLRKKRLEQEEKATRRVRMEELRRKRVELQRRDPVRRLPPDERRLVGPDQQVAKEHPSPAPAAEVQRLLCCVCGLPLDPLLAAKGCHVGPCEWSLGRWRWR